jgi:hypothetical protein
VKGYILTGIFTGIFTVYKNYLNRLTKNILLKLHLQREYSVEIIPFLNMIEKMELNLTNGREYK